MQYKTLRVQDYDLLLKNFRSVNFKQKLRLPLRNKPMNLYFPTLPTNLLKRGVELNGHLTKINPEADNHRSKNHWIKVPIPRFT